MHSLDRALLNLRILEWWHSNNAVWKALILGLYAKSIGCPVCEVCEEMNQPDDLVWLWNNFSDEIILKTS